MLYFWHRNGIFEMDNRTVLSLCGGCFNVLRSVGIYVIEQCFFEVNFRPIYSTFMSLCATYFSVLWYVIFVCFFD